MPIFAADYSGAKHLSLKATGSIDIVEMRAAVDEFRAGERRSMPILLDLTEATLTFSPADVASLAENRAAENKRSSLGPLALVATTDEPFGISRMFKSYSDVNGRTRVGVFRDAPTAQRWLQSLE